jgi:hypothetical protein
MTAGLIRDLQKDAEGQTPAGLMIEILARCIKAWSYDAPIDVETIADLDSVTLNWLETEVNLNSGVRSAAEKKGLNGNSPSSTSPPEPASSPSLVSLQS